MKTKTLVVLLAMGVGASALAGCPSTFSVCEEGPCGTADGSTPETGPGPDVVIPDSGKDADPIPTGCDTPTEPAKNPEKCLTDEFGSFVSPSGNDGNPGTKALPYKTLGQALKGTRARIVVCEGDYAGSVEVTRAVEIYGGASCDFTKAGGKAKVVAAKAGYGIKVEKVSGAVVLADLEVVGANGAAPSESSVGVFVTEGGDVKVLRSRIEAGDGADAPPKRDGNYTLAAKAPDGQMAVGNTGGPGGDSGVCPGAGQSKGGKGGDLGSPGDDAAPRPPGGVKGVAAACAGAGTGGDGDAGNPGEARGGATSLVSLSVAGIIGSKGQDGAAGSIGGGGGGGLGISGAGGGGGAGGCGGQGGFGGGAGGSSVAVVSHASTVKLLGVELVAKTAKAGGVGGAGQRGQDGGARGVGSNLACNGGNGAKGGDGGAGGGGAGGVAAGIAWAGGKEPEKDAATKITRPTGAAPQGGMGGAGASNKGVDGVHADVFEVK